MLKHLAAPPQHQCWVITGARLATECGIIADEAVNCHPFAGRRLAEHEISRWIGVEVLHGDCNQAECICGHTRLEESQHVTGKNL
jgi:hypothetical protein